MASKVNEKSEVTEFEIDVASLLGESKDAMDEADEPALDLSLDGDAPPSDEISVGDEETGVVEIPTDLASQLLDILQDEVGEGDEPAEEPVDEPAEEGGEEMGDDDVVEIDESAIRAELKKMREASKSGAAASSVTSSFGGGKATKDVFADGKDEDLNVYAEVKRLDAELKNESRKNRALGEKLSEAKRIIAKLQEQVEQVNLFNAKLLYTSKILVNESVNASQRKRIVTTLDGAKTLDEVKLLYKGFCESLSGARKPVKEAVSRKVTGASRPTSSGGATADASDHVARWGTLAGIPDSTK